MTNVPFRAPPFGCCFSSSRSRFAPAAQAQLYETRADTAFLIDAETGTPDPVFQGAGQAHPAGLAGQADDDGGGVSCAQDGPADTRRTRSWSAKMPGGRAGPCRAVSTMFAELGSSIGSRI